jgi:hypothetical protein
MFFFCLAFHELIHFIIPMNINYTFQEFCNHGRGKRNYHTIITYE